MYKELSYDEKKTILQLASEKILHQQKQLDDAIKELQIHRHYMKVTGTIMESQDRVSDRSEHPYRLAKELEFMAYTLERTDTDPLPKDGTCGQTQNERPKNASEFAEKLSQ